MEKEEMIYVLIPNEPLPEQVAKALKEYYERHGTPPAPITIEMGGGEVEIREFSLGEEE